MRDGFVTNRFQTHFGLSDFRTLAKYRVYCSCDYERGREQTVLTRVAVSVK